MDTNLIQSQFEAFVAEYPIQAALDISTTAFNRSNKRVILELWETGYRVIPFVPHYESSRICLFLPFLDKFEWDDKEPRLRFYDFAIDRIKADVQAELDKLREAQ